MNMQALRKAVSALKEDEVHLYFIRILAVTNISGTLFSNIG